MAHGLGRRLAAVAVMVWAVPAAAEEISVEAPITAVTVFPDRAKVTRIVEVELPAGEHELALNRLPFRLDPRSVRISGEGTGRLELGAVNLTRTYQGDAARREEERELREQLQALRDRDQTFEDRLSALQAQQAFITGIGAKYPDVMSAGVLSGTLNPGAWAEAWTQIGTGLADTLRQMQDLRIERRALKEEIRIVQDAYNRLRSGSARRVEARFAVSAATDLTARLTVSYQVPGAYWKPVYDARLDTEARKVTLVQKGEVRQSTGEDWTGVRLTLSTAQPAVGARRPELEPWTVDVMRDRIVVTGSRIMRDEPSGGALDRDSYAAEEAPAPPPEPEAEPVRAEHRQAAVQATEFTAQYEIVGRVDVPSGSSTKTFPVTERILDATYSVYAAPRVASRAWLVAEMTYPDDDPLPAGGAAVFRDGAFIGGGTIDTVRPGESFELAFGVDERVQIDYRTLEDKRSSEGLLGGEERLTRRHRIEVTNRHGEAVPITIEDRMPVSRDERIRVSLTRDTTTPSSRDPEDRKGVVVWEQTFEPGESREFTFGWFVQYPDDLEIEGL